MGCSVVFIFFVSAYLCFSPCLALSGRKLEPCSEFHSSRAECDASSQPPNCGQCQYLDELCTECVSCPTWSSTVDAAGNPLPAQLDIIRCLYNVTGACGLSCLLSTPYPTTASSAVSSTGSVLNEITLKPPAVDEQQTASIIAYSVIGAVFLLICVGVAGFSAFHFSRVRRRRRNPTENPRLLSIGVCTACDRVVEGAGQSPDGLYCECQPN